MITGRPSLAIEVGQDGERAIPKGHINAYGYHPTGQCWLFVGWTSRPWNELAILSVTAQFRDRDETGRSLAGFYDRPGFEGRGVVIALWNKAGEKGLRQSGLVRVRVDGADFTRDLDGHASERMGSDRLAEVLHPILLRAAGDAGLSRLLTRLPADIVPVITSARVHEGHVDVHAHDPSLGGWLYLGWVARQWTDANNPTAMAQHGKRTIEGKPAASFFERADVHGRGFGCLIFLPDLTAPREKPAPLLSLDIDIGSSLTRLEGHSRPPASLEQLRAALPPSLEATPPDRWFAALALPPPYPPEPEPTPRAFTFGDGKVTRLEPASGFAEAETGLRHGHVDFYGYHSRAAAWFFCGWVSEPWSDSDKPKRIVAHFDDGPASSEASTTTFYYRDDIGGRGVGFVLALPSANAERDHLTVLDLQFAQSAATLPTTAASPNLSARELGERLNPLLAGGEANSHRARLRAMLSAETGETHEGGAPGGFIDFYGYHTVAGGWLFCGWLSSETEAARGAPTIVALFERGELRGDAASVYYPRDDLGDRGAGIVLFVPSPGNPLGGLLSLTVEVDSLSARVYPSTSIRRLREQSLLTASRTIVTGAPPTPQREVMLSILRRQGFSGRDTVGELNDRVFLELDEAIFCDPDGIALIGWHLAEPGVVCSHRLRCGTLVSTINLDDSVKIERPDVVSTVGEQYGFDDMRCGFIVFLPHAIDGASTPYIEIETRRGEVGYRPVPQAKLGGTAAIKRLLEDFDGRFLDVPRAYDAVIGPAVERLTKNRLKTRPAVTALDYGTPPADPEFSVIIPLYGRIDFVEYQLALISAHPPSRHHEFIYVLDDPPKRREAQFLFASVYERLHLPFRALLLDRNIGFGPANNIGLRHARGKYVCFLNSDAFPGSPDWLERLAARLAAHPELGAIGPLLLYEDGSIQHQGMSFRQLGEFGGWHFGHHPGKGMRPGGAKGLRRCISITGACILMERALAERMRGFDEAYAIGDFEDSDLCLRLYRTGRACAVDLDVHLYHLERKSQAGSSRSWRMNLTLYNAWVHERRWARVIAAHPQAAAPTPPTGEAGRS